MFREKISDNAPFFLQLFAFVHVPPIVSVPLTYSLKINSLLFRPTLYISPTTRFHSVWLDLAACQLPRIRIHIIAGPHESLVWTDATRGARNLSLSPTTRHVTRRGFTWPEATWEKQRWRRRRRLTSERLTQSDRAPSHTRWREKCILRFFERVTTTRLLLRARTNRSQSSRPKRGTNERLNSTTRTRTDFFCGPRVSEKLCWVRAGLRQSPCGSARVRSGPVGPV